LADEELVVLEEEVALADKELVEEVDEDEEGKRVSFWLEKEVDWVSITEIEVTEKIRKNFFLECHYFFNEKRKIFFSFIFIDAKYQLYVKDRSQFFSRLFDK
jgi:nucleoside-specific outer membrane channel protein Tsx